MPFTSAKERLDLVENGGVPIIGAQARRNLTLAVATAAETVVPLEVEMYDAGGFWVIGSPTRMTIPAGKGGRYLIEAASRWPSSALGTERAVFVMKNGTDYLRFDRRFPASRSEAGLSFEENLVAGDYVEMWVYHDAGMSLNFGDSFFWPRFGVRRVGPTP